MAANWQSSWFLVGFLALCVINDSSATITKTPRNTLVLYNQNATLECSTDSTRPQGGNTIIWLHDHDIISYVPCTPQNTDFRAASPDPDSDCNVIALPGGVGAISGPYECDDNSVPTAVAMLIVLNSEPSCGPVVPLSFVNESESVDFTCSMTYSWHSLAQQSNVVPLINVSFGWVQDEDETPPFITRLPSLQSTRSEEASLTVASARKPSVPSQICKLSFTFAAQTHYSLFLFAVNPVSHQCITDPIPVRPCVQWLVFENQNAFGAVELSSQYDTVTACQQFCIITPQCVAVDFDTNVHSCWASLHPDQLLPDNIYNLPGVTQYQIIRSCETTTTDTTSATSTSQVTPSTSTSASPTTATRPSGVSLLSYTASTQTDEPPPPPLPLQLIVGTSLIIGNAFITLILYLRRYYLCCPTNKRCCSCCKKANEGVSLPSQPVQQNVYGDINSVSLSLYEEMDVNTQLPSQHHDYYNVNSMTSSPYEELDLNTQRPVNYPQLPSQTGQHSDYYNVN